MTIPTKKKLLRSIWVHDAKFYQSLTCYSTGHATEGSKLTLKYRKSNVNMTKNMLTMRSSPPRSISPMNAMSFRIGISKQLKKGKRRQT